MTTAAAPAAPPKTRPLWLTILAASTIVAMGMGLRQVMGLYQVDLTKALGIGREPFSNSMAIANLAWGVFGVGAGLVADRFGAGRVVITCALATIGGLIWMSLAQSTWDLYFSGLLLGLGVAGTSVSALVGAVGRAAPADKRTAAIASLGMAAGVGQLIAFPYAHLLIEYTGWKASLQILAATGLAMLPMAWFVAGKPSTIAVAGAPRSQTLREAFDEAFRLRSFWLLTFGFFVCGFHVAFYGVHLPAYAKDMGLPPWAAVWALIAVGIANIAGTYIAGQSSRVIERRKGLSLIYFMRIFAFIALLMLPMTPWMLIAISAFLGLFWLSTVPLTSSLISVFFGTQWMSMLYGFVFLSHQVGSFTGLWLAGKLYDQTGSYNTMWWICIGMGLFAAAIHWPISEKPVSRLAQPQAA